MFRRKTFVAVLGLIIICSFLLTSCASKKNVVYFQDAGSFETLVNTNNFVSKFKVDDLVSIFVSTLDPEASAPFNLIRPSQEGSFRSEQVDYLVDREGEIDFPVIGKVKIAGLSPEEVRILLRNKLSDYLKDPIINIRLRNYTVTILGEVNSPGTYPVNGEQITVLEALGYAGDLTIKGMRSNVLVIRDFNGTKVYNRIDLTSKEIMKSPVYYLTQNDVVYIEPNQSAVSGAVSDNRISTLISIVSLLITTSAIIITRN